jgi:hypothetical protein
VAREVNRLTLPGHLWPTRAELDVYGTETKAEVIMSPERKGLVALRVETRIEVSDSPRKQRRVTTYWMDPMKDDMPVETLRQSYKADGQILAEETRIVYQDPVQAKNGRWYPSKWVQTIKKHGGKELNQMTEVHLKVWSDRQLGKEWFADLWANAKK